MSGVRCSNDELVCVGSTRERLKRALELALWHEEMRWWASDDGAAVLASARPNGGVLTWNEVPPGLDAGALVVMFWPAVMQADSHYQGPMSDGTQVRGWRVSVDVTQVVTRVVIAPWTMTFAK